MEGAILIDITKLFFWQVVVKKYLNLDWFVMSIAYWSLDRIWSTMAIYFLNGSLFWRGLIKERLPLIQEGSGKYDELNWVGNIIQKFWCNEKHCHWCERSLEKLPTCCQAGVCSEWAEAEQDTGPTPVCAESWKQHFRMSVPFLIHIPITYSALCFSQYHVVLFTQQQPSSGNLDFPRTHLTLIHKSQSPETLP